MLFAKLQQLWLKKPLLAHRGNVLATMFFTGTLAFAGQPGLPDQPGFPSLPGRATYVVTSTNDTNRNSVVVFNLNEGKKTSLTLAQTLPTGGKGGAGGNAGILQFQGELGAVANFGSNTVTQLVRRGNSFGISQTIRLLSGCQGPDSIALTGRQLFVAGATCAESYAWPWGYPDGSTVSLPDNSAGQIVVGNTWAAVTLKSGSVLKLPLTHNGTLNGSASSITLPADTNDTPLGAAFWGDVLGFNPAHSANSFALIGTDENVIPVAGPAPAFPSNAPCWLVKGPRSLWYSGNSPGQAVSIFFSDDKGGVFYKSVPVPGVPTDITVSPDGDWLATIYTAADGAHIALFSIDDFGDLKQEAVSPAIGVAAFNGVAFSQ